MFVSTATAESTTVEAQWGMTMVEATTVGHEDDCGGDSGVDNNGIDYLLLLAGSSGFIEEGGGFVLARSCFYGRATLRMALL
ncbi:conserved hypothetical protein [Ricinus communis]|uniref:Uncharacterized protein n=1 Tax=Ricinus communis TaxID=3988 RepID=B9T1T4_RICCO|nr:conserved hypothetical protein [Ricinus communis]